MGVLSQTREIVLLNLRSIPSRLGASLVIVIGIAGVVAVLVAMLAMSRGLSRTLEDTGAPDRVVVLRGAGRNFCAGGDIKDFAAKGEGLPDYLRQATSYLQIVAGALMRLNAPVIASVQGFAAGGGGVGLVCASDFVIAAE